MLHLKQTVFLLLVLAFCACQNQKNIHPTFFPKPPEEKLDSVGIWLSQDSNYLTDKYLPFFQTHFNQQIAVQNIDSAARLLDIAGYVAMENYAFDSILAQMHLDFLAKYETQIPHRFRSGLYNNLGDFYSSTELISNNDYGVSISFFKKNNDLPKDYYSALNNALANLGIMFCFSNTAEHDSSVIYGLKALDFFEKYENVVEPVNIYNTLARNYEGIEDNFMAEKYADLGVACSIKSKDSSVIGLAMVNRVRLFENMESTRFFSCMDSLEQFEAEWQPQDPKYRFLTQSLKVKKLIREGKINDAEKILKKIAPLYPFIKHDYFNEYYPDALSEYEIATQKPVSMEQYYVDRLKMLDSTRYFLDIATNNYYQRIDD